MNVTHRVNLTYEKMPKERPHRCHAVNMSGIPTEWIEYQPDHGFELFATNAYGDGYITNITFCPWCGVRLMLPEHEATLGPGGKRNRKGIRVEAAP